MLYSWSYGGLYCCYIYDGGLLYLFIYYISGEGLDVFTVAVHELGHVLGLSHTREVPEAVMAPFYQGYHPNLKLHPDDIAGCRHLYPGKVSDDKSSNMRMSCSLLQIHSHTVTLV